jgi:hypothetical protein
MGKIIVVYILKKTHTNTKSTATNYEYDEH